MTNAEEIVRAVESFYRGYIDAFNREDVDQYTDAFAFPYAWISGEGGISLCANESDHQRWLGRVMSALKERGWSRSGIDRMRAWPMAENLAMVMADYTRYKSDGTILENGRACYTVRRDGKAWKIVALAEVKPPFLGPGDMPR
jgi:ketosteroid isomerase-like protein